MFFNRSIHSPAVQQRHKIDLTPSSLQSRGDKTTEKVAQYVAEIPIWNTDSDEGRCGHASISLIKINKNGKKQTQHMGLWPKNLGAANPFTLPFPISAQHVDNISTDKDYEGDIDSNGVETPLDPDQVYQIPLSKEQYQNMSEKMTSEKEKIDSGQVVYSLFSKWNVFHVAKPFTSEHVYDDVARDPFSGDTMDLKEAYEPLKPFQDMELENCTTEVAKILQSGGIGVGVSEMTPWGLSPNGLDSELSQYESIKV